MPGELNIFQRAMLQWNDLQPYNAVHVAWLPALLDPGRLRQAIETTLVQRGISCLTLQRRPGTYTYSPGAAAVAIRILPPADAGTDDALTAELEHELNSPFPCEAPFCPARFFALPNLDGFHLGTAYFHAAADAESVALLVRSIIETYVALPTAARLPPFDCHPPRHDRLWRTQPGLLFRKLLGIPAETGRMRHAIRLHSRDAEDVRNRCRLIRVRPDRFAALLDAARSWSVTVHDLLLALLIDGLAPLAARRTHNPRRNQIVIGSVVNIRNECAIDRDRAFGLFLGSFMVSHPVPAGVGLRDVAAELHRQTEQIKRRKLYLASPIGLAVADWFFRLYSDRRRKQFYHKYHPLAGGTSNMMMDAYWKVEAQPRPKQYFRAVSTGPMTPLVLSTTTYDRQMTIALTYRAGVLTPTGAGELQSRIEAGLNRLGAGT
jgi:hypothetical protein